MFLYLCWVIVVYCAYGGLSRESSYLFTVYPIGVMDAILLCGGSNIFGECDLFTHILRGCCTGTGAIIWLPQSL